MKKISVLLIVVFILNIFVVGNAFATNVCKISASFNPNNPYLGKEVSIKISVSEITEEISVVGFTLNYDSNIFEYSGIEKADGWSIIPIEGIRFNIHTDSYEGTKTAGAIGTIKLKVKDNANLGNTLIKISDIEVAKDDASTIEIGDLEQNISIQKEETNNTSTDTNTSTNTNTDTNTNTNTSTNTNIDTNTSTNTSTNTNIETNTSTNTNTNINTNTAIKENANTDTEKNIITTSDESINTKEENKNINLPYTGNAPMFIGGILIISSIFSIIAYKKYLKYRKV